MEGLADFGYSGRLSGSGGGVKSFQVVRVIELYRILACEALEVSQRL